MVPPIATTPPTITVSPIASSVPVASAPATKSRSNRVSVSSATHPVPLTSPALDAAPAFKKIAQSELPGGSTPPAPTSPTAPPEPSIRDTGSGYPTRIPANYFGPALGFGNGNTAFGVISRFPFGDKYSLRPSAIFGTTTTLRVPVTYDFALGDKEPFERNPLIVFNAGAGVQYTSGGSSSQFGLLGTIGVDVNLFDGVVLVGSFNTDFASKNGTNVGLGFEF